MTGDSDEDFQSNSSDDDVESEKEDVLKKNPISLRWPQAENIYSDQFLLLLSHFDRHLMI